MAVESGVNGTHFHPWGRQLDMTMGVIEMLLEIVDAAEGRAEIYVDSGVRRGNVVIKALAPAPGLWLSGGLFSGTWPSTA